MEKIAVMMDHEGKQCETHFKQVASKNRVRLIRALQRHQPHLSFTQVMEIERRILTDYLYFPVAYNSVIHLISSTDDDPLEFITQLFKPKENQSGIEELRNFMALQNKQLKEESAYICPCGSKRFILHSYQNRSADEPERCVRLCENCGRKRNA